VIEETEGSWHVPIGVIQFCKCRKHVLKGVQSWHDFGITWHIFLACWTRFEDKVGRTLGRTHQPWHDLANRDTFLSVSVYYLSVSLQILSRVFERETWEYKGGNFRVECLCREVLLVRKHCKHLGEWKSLNVLFIWWDWEKRVEIRFCSLWAFVLISCNPFVISLEDLFDSGLESCSLPQIRSYWAELGQQSLVCLFLSFIAYPYCFCLCLWYCSTLGFRVVCWCCCLKLFIHWLSLPLLHTSLYFHWCDFVRIHNKIFIGVDLSVSRLCSILLLVLVLSRWRLSPLYAKRYLESEV